jgi:hypothetical protein
MSARDRRAVSIGGGILFAALFVLWAVKPYAAALGDTRDRLAVERDALAREEAAVALARQNPRLQLVADSTMAVMQPRLFAGRDDVIASSELASYLGEAAQRSRVWLQDASTRPSLVGKDGVRTLQVEIRARSDLRGTMRFLQTLEHGTKLVRVDRLDIARAPGSNDDPSETLTVTATIAGFATADASRQPAGSVSAPAAAQAGVIR